MSDCVSGLIISTLKTMKVISFGRYILKVRTTGKFIQALAKERLVTRVDRDV